MLMHNLISQFISGILFSMKISGKELIKKGPVLNVWRAPLANETDDWTFGSSNIKHRTEGFGRMAATEWYSSGIDRIKMIVEKFSWEKDFQNRISIEVRTVCETGTGRGSFIDIKRYLINGLGEISLENSIIPHGDMPAWLPRIGQQLILDKSLDQISWFGRGPQENYPDRKSGYKVGLYSSTVNEMYEPYLIPQDYGLRTDNQWVMVTDMNGTGIEFRGDKPFNFSAYPYSTENLTKAVYTYQLHPAEEITFNFDYATSGVGCTATGVFPEYQVMPGRYDFKITIRPVRP